MENMVSVIIPVYNVERYLDRCVASVIAQTYSNLQIILVNDGSTDQSAVLCDRWREKDKRVVVIHKENGGLSNARNSGLRVAKGEYILFIDSDDYIANNMIEILMDSILNDGVDVAVCGVKEFDETENYRLFRSGGKKEIVRSQDALVNIFSGKAMIAVMNRLYRASVLRDVVFAEGRLYEDVVFDADIFTINPSMKVAFLPDPLYYYFRRNDSIMGQTEKISPSFDLLYVYSYLFKKIKGLDVYAQRMIITCAMYYLLSFPFNKKTMSTQFKIELKKLIRKFYKYQSVKQVGIRYKIKTFLFAYGRG